MVAQHYKFTRIHWTVHLRWLNVMVLNYLLVKLFKKSEKQFKCIEVHSTHNCPNLHFNSSNLAQNSVLFPMHDSYHTWSIRFSKSGVYELERTPTDNFVYPSFFKRLSV